MMATPLRLAVASRADVQQARREVRALANGLGFGHEAGEQLTIAVSELGMNLLHHAEEGVLCLSWSDDVRGGSIQVESSDRGPGIEDVGLALRDGYSTSGGLGSGLPAVRRLMDEFSIETGTAGTRIVARKWKTRPS